MDGELIERPVAPGVVEVVVRIDDEEAPRGDVLGHLADIGHTETGVEQDRVVRALHEPRVDVARLGDEVNATLHLRHFEPRCPKWADTGCMLRRWTAHGVARLVCERAVRPRDATLGCGRLRRKAWSARAVAGSTRSNLGKPAP